MSRTKIEQKAITKVRELVDEIEFFKPLLNENDKGISWDGTIEMYNGNIDKKSNYDYTIDVQVKGRTTPNKKLKDKHRFTLDKVDLENYLKKDGTILLLCLFKESTDEFQIYYATLLPYNIRKLLKQYSSSKIKIDMKKIVSPNHFETICRNYKLDREMQKGIQENIFNEDNLISSNGKIAKFYLWEKDYKNFYPENLVGSWKYIYTIDENGYTINIDYAEFTNLIENLNVKISSKDSEIIFDDVMLETNTEEQKLIFGKAFSLNLKKKKFNITICGTLVERIKQLKFINFIFETGFFLINDKKFKIDYNLEADKKFNTLLKKYTKINVFFEKHNIHKDINFDSWNDDDFNKLYLWISVIDDKKEIALKSDISLVGTVKIKELKISVFAKIKNNKKFEIESLWNNDIYNKYYFKYKSNLEEIKTNNFYLVLNSEAYQSDDINIEEMKKTFDNKQITNGEFVLMNLQVLEILKAFDITKNNCLLEYAKYLAYLLLEHDKEEPIYYINYCQILKRLDSLTDENIEKLINIRDENNALEIKLGCNLLLDNKNDIKILVDRMDKDMLDVFKKYPISIYL